MDKNIALNCSTLLRELLTDMRRKKENLFVNDQLQPNNFEVSFHPKESRFPVTLPQNLAMLLRDRIDGLNVGSGCRVSEFES